MHLSPKLPCGTDRINTLYAPPVGFIAGSVQLAGQEADHQQGGRGTK